MLAMPPLSWLFWGRAAFVCAALALAVASLTPSDYLPHHSAKDKVLHFVGYAVLAVFALQVIRNRSRQAGCMVILVVMGIALEFGQMFVPGRSFELWDMAANGCGVYAAFLTVRRFSS
jgi:VanZ family protein